MLTFQSNVSSLLSKPASAKPNPRFGCRFFVYYPSNPGQEGQDKFIRQCFYKGGNSMERQEQLELWHSGETLKPAIQNFPGRPSNEPTEKAGWGLVHSVLTSGGAFLQKVSDCAPIWTNPGFFHRAVDQAAASGPKVVVGFLRERDADKVEDSTLDNTHPLRPGNADWTLSHFGDITPPLTAALEKELKRLHREDSNIPLWTTQVDSEKFACYIAAKFYEKHGSIDISGLPDREVRKVLKETINEFRNWPGMENWTSKQKEKARNGTLNLIITDGKRVFGVRDGAPTNESRQTFIGSHADSAGMQEALFATDPFQPLDGSAPIKWSRVPYHTVFSLNLDQPVKAQDEVKQLKTTSLDK